MYAGGGEMHLAGAGTVPHLHLAVGAGAPGGNPRPDVQAFENALTAADKALTRGSKAPAWSKGLTLNGPPSSSMICRPLCCSAKAKALPTIPAPTMITSACNCMLKPPAARAVSVVHKGGYLAAPSACHRHSQQRRRRSSHP